jgi:hypothetical protein
MCQPRRGGDPRPLSRLFKERQMKTLKFDDCPRSAVLRPRLWLATIATARKFSGMPIDGYCDIESQYPLGRHGTTYELLLAPDVRPLVFMVPAHSDWCDGLATWDQVAAELKLPRDVVREIVRTEYPATAQRLDEVERLLTR